MAARRQPHPEDSPVNRFGQADEEAIQRYLHLTDDGEIARLAAMMTPPKKVMNARALVAQAAALQVEAAAELVRQREVMAESMSLATLSELAGRLGVDDLGFLLLIDEDNLGDNDPIQGPVLRRLATLMRDLPPPQDFTDLFLAEKPTDALNRASSRTSLRRPLPDATLEKLLRFAANIPEDVISWDILNGAFIDFLRIWFQDRLGLEELIRGGPGAGPKKSKDSSVVDRIERLQRERIRFYNSFKPGHEFPADIVELAHRAYTECWEGGILGPQWQRRFAWLADEFPPFWQKFGDAYCAIHQARVKAAAEAEAARMKAAADAEAEIRRQQNKKSAKARKSGEAGLQRREGKRWRTVTADFIVFLNSNIKKSEGLTLSSSVDTFVETNTTLGKSQNRASARQFLSALCAAATEGKDAGYVLRTFQRPLAASITAVGPEAHERFLSKMTPSQRREFETKSLVPRALLQNKNVTAEAVGACLEDLKQALFKVRHRNSKK